jgi:hypothetical protein
MEPLATRLDRAVRATPRLICKVGRSLATGCISGFNLAIAPRFDCPGASSNGSGTDDCAAGGSMTTGGVMIGLLVSSTTFSGHLRADLIRMVALSMISGRSGKLSGGSGKIQPAINRRTASALPTTIKYLAMGTADSSRSLAIAVSPWQRRLTTLILRGKSIRGATPPHRAFTGEDDAPTRGNSPSPFPKRRLPGHARWRESNKAPSRSPALPA